MNIPTLEDLNKRLEGYTLEQQVDFLKAAFLSSAYDRSLLMEELAERRNSNAFNEQR